MKKPSRLMPKYRPPKLSPIRWVLALIVLLFYIYALCLFPWIILLIPVILIASKLQNKKYDQNIRKIAASRIGEDIGTFAKQFDCHQIDTWVIRAVYEQFQLYLENVYPGFPLHPDDNIYEDLVADPDDFDMELIEEIAQRAGRSLDSIEKNPHADKIDTIRGAVLFFNAQPRSTT